MVASSKSYRRLEQDIVGAISFNGFEKKNEKFQLFVSRNMELKKLYEHKYSKTCPL